MTTDDQWSSLPVDKFMQGEYLQRSDIILVGGSGLTSKIISYFTKSLFSHAALVFLISNKDKGFEHNFLIESVTSGVDVTAFDYYAAKSKNKPIAILRLEQEWFDIPLQNQIRGSMLNYIKSDYDFMTILKITGYIVKKLFFGLKVRSIKKSIQKGRRVPNQFICSGFVQYGYYSSVKKMTEAGDLSASAIDKVLFRSDLGQDSADSELLSVTPEDLASSDKLSWKYVIKNGMVYKVESARQGREILK